MSPSRDNHSDMSDQFSLEDSEEFVRAHQALAALRHDAEHNELTNEQTVVSAMSAAFQGEKNSRGFAWQTRLHFAYLRTRVAAAIVMLALVSTTGMAYADVLPKPMQAVTSKTLVHVGLHVPDPDTTTTVTPPSPATSNNESNNNHRPARPPRNETTITSQEGEHQSGDQQHQGPPPSRGGNDFNPETGNNNGFPHQGGDDQNRGQQNTTTTFSHDGDGGGFGSGSNSGSGGGFSGGEDGGHHDIRH